MRFVHIGIEKAMSLEYGIVRFNYKEGPLRGKGVWSVREAGEHTCRITYTTHFLPVSMFIDSICAGKAFERKHSKDIKELIASLEKYGRSME